MLNWDGKEKEKEKKDRKELRRKIGCRMVFSCGQRNEFQALFFSSLLLFLSSSFFIRAGFLAQKKRPRRRETKAGKVWTASDSGRTYIRIL